MGFLFYFILFSVQVPFFLLTCVEFKAVTCFGTFHVGMFGVFSLIPELFIYLFIFCSCCVLGFTRRIKRSA